MNPAAYFAAPRSQNPNEVYQGFDFGDPAHVAIYRISRLNAATLTNPPAPPPIAAGIGATAMGAAAMLSAGIQPPIIYLKPL